MESCFLSHWGIDGLKPYMRYSLAGGYQSNAENVRGSNYCAGIPDWWYSLCAAVGDVVEPAGDVCTRAADWWYRANDSVEQEIREAIQGWMGSPGHRRTMLNPRYKKVNIGLAWNRHNIAFVQQFEGDYFQYIRIPAIKNGTLTLAGRLKNGARFLSEKDLGIQIYYDPAPRTLSRGQLSLTSCYDSGRLTASLRPPIPETRRYKNDSFTRSYRPCISPHRVPYDTPGPQSYEEANQLWSTVKAVRAAIPEQSITVPWITASDWDVTTETGRFSIKADLGRLPAGVYTVVVWATVDGEDVVISEYSVFERVTPPDTYSRW